jgi:hypothetical protein
MNPSTLPVFVGVPVDLSVAVGCHGGPFGCPLADFGAEVTRRGVLDKVRFVERGDTAALSPINPPFNDPAEASDHRHR